MSLVLFHTRQWVSMYVEHWFPVSSVKLSENFDMEMNQGEFGHLLVTGGDLRGGKLVGRWKSGQFGLLLSLQIDSGQYILTIQIYMSKQGFKSELNLEKKRKKLLNWK